MTEKQNIMTLTGKPKPMPEVLHNRNHQPGKRGVFLVGLLLAVSCLALGIGTSSQAKEAENTPSEHSVPVVVSHPEQRTFENRIVTQGNIEAEHVAMVSPRIPGTLEEIYVDEGDAVVAGKTRLFATDAVKLEQNVVIQEHALAVARCGHQQALANQEKVAVDLNKAEMDFRRFERLLKNGNTTQNIFEQQQSRYLQISAAHKLTSAQVDLAAEQVRQAEAALTIAKKDLADTRVPAPINGVVAKRYQEPGEMGQPGKPVFYIVDTVDLEVNAFLPAASYPEVVVRETPLHVSVNGKDLGILTITRKSPVIQPKLRTFEVIAALRNPSGEVAPGAMAQVTVILSSRKQWGIPASAVIYRGGSSVIFLVDNDQKAHMQKVTTGLTMDGWVEITQDGISKGWKVVVMGQSQLEDGAFVSVQKGEN